MTIIQTKWYGNYLKKVAGIGASVFCLLLIPTLAMAVDAPPKRGQTIQQKYHPELEPAGIPVSSFTVFPTLTYEGEFNDNIFSRASNPVGDYISVISPSVKAQSDWGKHALNLSADVDIGRYAIFSEEEYEDWIFKSNGRIDIRNNIQLFIDGRYKQKHEARSSLEDNRGANEPTVFTEGAVFTRYKHGFGRLFLNMDFEFSRKNYDDVNRLVNGVSRSVNNDDRDRNEYTLGLTSNFEIDPSHAAYFRVSGNLRDYDTLQDSGLNRSSDGFEITTGMIFDYGGLILGDISVGYRTQNYKHQLVDISEPLYNIELDWNVTALTTISFDSERSYNETGRLEFSGFLTTYNVFSVSHELRRNFLVQFGFDHLDNEYKGHLSDRLNEESYSGFIEMIYKFNRYLHTALSYRYFDQGITRFTPVRPPATSAVNSSASAVSNVLFFQIKTQF